LTAYWLLPAPAQLRAYSLILALEGNPLDSSAVTRWERTADALAKALQRPWGWGWAGTGWVHNDFLVVAAQLGLVAGLLFAGAYLMTLWRMWSRVRQYAPDEERGILGFALLLSLVAVGGLLGTHPIAVLPQLALPVWLIWVLAEIWMRQQQAPHETAER
jgi:O-antigen ligase